jgi:hypothetical protein
MSAHDRTVGVIEKKVRISDKSKVIIAFLFSAALRCWCSYPLITFTHSRPSSH